MKIKVLHKTLLLLAAAVLAWGQAQEGFAAPGKTGPASTSAASPGSALDRFRAHRGVRSTKAFLSLLDQGTQAGFTQEPRAVLSDGREIVKLFFSAKTSGKAPEAVCKNASLISIMRDSARPDGWVAEVQPREGAHSASVRVGKREFPLTVAPELPAGTVSPRAFNLYTRGKRQDLNNDGRSDYLDDYIYTVNFAATLPARQAAAKQNK